MMDNNNTPATEAALAAAPEDVQEMFNSYRVGRTLRTVAEEFSISHEMVRQLFLTHGLPIRDRGRRTTRVPRRPARRDEHRRAGPGRRWTRADALHCLRQANSLTSGELTGETYDSIAEGRTLVNGTPWPLKQSIVQCFNGWIRAKEAAGIETHRTPSHRVSETDCLRAVALVCQEHGPRPTVDQYKALRRSRRPDLPSVSLIYQHLGSWPAAVEQARGGLSADAAGSVRELPIAASTPSESAARGANPADPQADDDRLRAFPGVEVTYIGPKGPVTVRADVGSRLTIESDGSIALERVAA